MTDKTLFLFILLYLSTVHLKASMESSQTLQDKATRSNIESLVRKWAPLVWLAPGENFLPDSIEDFLQHTRPGDYYGRMMSYKDLQDVASDKLYLHTLNKIDDLLTNEPPSFLHGKDPTAQPVPVYAIVTKCPSWGFHVTYWLFFPYSLGKDICILGTIPLPSIFNTCLGTKITLGSHVGDFEHLSMSFKTNETHPNQIALGTHESGVYYTWNPKSKSFLYSEQIKRKFLAPKPKFPLEIKQKRKRIELFSSLGSHGLWAEPGEHNYHRFLGIMDSNGYGKPWKTWQDLKIYHLDLQLPKWMHFEGKWGNPRSKCLLWHYLCEITDGPPGILRPVKDFYCDKIEL